VQIANLRSIGLEADDFDLRRHEPATIGQRFGAPDFV
jgi:hypothetical protein